MIKIVERCELELYYCTSYRTQRSQVLKVLREREKNNVVLLQQVLVHAISGWLAFRIPYPIGDLHPLP